MGRSRPSLDDQIAQVNHRIKVAQLGVQIERRGQKLSLRGTFPPRPGSIRLRSHQQRLSLGLPATVSGLKQAEQAAKVIAAKLIEKSFDWRNYLLVSGGKPLGQLDLESQIQAFKHHFYDQPQRLSQPASTRTTWETAYAPYLRKLVAIAQSHAQYTLGEALQATLQSLKPNSRSRQIGNTALSAFAKFLGEPLPVQFRADGDSYSPRQVRARVLPDDRLIATVFSQIPNPSWRFVYGVMATYGLRNHEVFYCDFTALTQRDPEPTVRVHSTTKTGSREVWPFYPEWVGAFNLRQIQLPPVTTDLNQTTLQRIGQPVTCQFHRYRLPFNPYDLRHAWAVRTIHFGLPDTVAARMMGHSVAIHTRTYHHWMTYRDQQQAVQAALQKTQLRAPEFSSG